MDKKYGDEGNFGYAEHNDEQAFLSRLRTDGLVADEKLNRVHLCDYGDAHHGSGERCRRRARDGVGDDRHDRRNFGGFDD